MHTKAVFLEMEKAFDRVWHDGLIHKLHTMSNVPKHIKIIKSFLLDRYFKIEISNLHSSTRSIKAGAPQGSCLSPLLYTFYINDFPSSLHATASQFADDTTMFYSNNSNKNNNTHTRTSRQGTGYLNSVSNLT